VDIAEESPTVLSLCSGYGGLEIALRRIYGSLVVLAYVETEAYACANLVAKMETDEMAPAPIWTDLRTLPLQPFRNRVDILAGGYPCQDFSLIGKRKGHEGKRGKLWEDIIRIIDQIMPRMCFFENVEGHISLGLQEVLTDLESRGYETTWGIFSAKSVGAHHLRKRIFILANNNDTGRRSWTGDTAASKERKTSERLHKRENWNEIPESNLWGMDDGGADRHHRIRLLGNGVVPDAAERAIRVLSERLNKETK